MKILKDTPWTEGSFNSIDREARQKAFNSV
jgi:hypothetical protein